MAEVNGAAPAATETSTAPAAPALEAAKQEQQQQQQQQQQQPNHTRRLRPPNPLGPSTGDASRIPLRLPTTGSQKLSRRESRLGLRGLFFRNKPVVASDDLPDASCASPTVSSAGTGTGLWSRPFHSARSEITLSKNTATSETGSALALEKQGPALPASPAASRKSKPTRLTSTPRSKPLPSPRTGRGSLATWDPPPLFQAYPQAIKQAQLPVCKLSVDALIRFQGSHGSANALLTTTPGETTKDAAEDEAVSQATVDKDEPAGSSSVLDMDRAATEKDKGAADKTKRKHRRDVSGSSLKLDWQNKIFILVTSGYLLQYAGEGSFDRLPEKILHITKDSAAFASDLIPGRHWVLQVCSAMDADGTAPATDTRSLFSRLPFRGYERRQAATFLLVFDNADEMESWITTLRREIEQFGGKKHLSETGAPKVENTVARQSTQSSQRTLVVRDPDRFSRLITPQDLCPLSPRSEFGSIVDRTSDEMSATNSVYSHDGRQLDNLRNSSNRFSYISSGQRTMVASDSSSPPSSPCHDSFSSNLGCEQPLHLSEGKNTSRPLSNATASVARQPSTQQQSAGQRTADLHPVGLATASPTQVRVPIAPFAAALPPPPAAPPPIVAGRDKAGQTLAGFPLPPSPPTIPNFSVPHQANRRFSLASPRSPVGESTPAFPTLSPPLSAMESAPIDPVVRQSTRRMPPPSLVLPRPRPMKHLPSSREAPRVASRMNSHESSVPGSPDSDSSAPNTAALFSPWTILESQAVPDQSKELRTASHQTEARTALPVVDPSRMHAIPHTSPRRHSSMMALRSRDVTTQEAKHNAKATAHVRVLQTTRDGLPGPSTTSELAAPPRRTSMLVQPSSTAGSRPASVYRHGAMSGRGTQDGHKGGSLDTGRSRMAESLGPMKPLPALPTAPAGQRLRSRSTSSRLGGRHSMYQLAEGPPPAPPPTCALPPLPLKMEKPDSQTMALAI